jgi:hypothetical protein
MAQESPIPLTAQQTMVRAALMGMLKASPVLDRFAGWILGIGGLALGLMISNLDSIQSYLPIEAVKRFAWSFFVVFILGFLEKFVAAMVESGIASAEETEASLSGFLKEEIEIVEAPFDPQSVVKELRDTLWYPMKWLVSLGAKKGANDPIWSIKFVTRLFQLQLFLVVAEVGVTLFSIAVVGVAL